MSEKTPSAAATVALLAVFGLIMAGIVMYDAAAEDAYQQEMAEVDRLLAAFESTRAPPEPTGWRVSRSRDPLDDSPTIALRLAASQGVSDYGDAFDLVLVCQSNKTSAYVEWGQFIDMDAGRVTVRVGSAPAVEERWRVSTDYTSTFAPRAIPLIRRLVEADRLVMRVTPYGAAPKTATFRLAGLSANLPALRTACNW